MNKTTFNLLIALFSILIARWLMGQGDDLWIAIVSGLLIILSLVAVIRSGLHLYKGGKKDE